MKTINQAIKVGDKFINVGDYRNLDIIIEVQSIVGVDNNGNTQIVVDSKWGQGWLKHGVTSLETTSVTTVEGTLYMLGQKIWRKYNGQTL